MSDRTCVGCGGFLDQLARGRPRKWCSRECALNNGGHFKRTYVPVSPAAQTKSCAHCGEAFYGSASRKYCSDKCKHRRAWELRRQCRPKRATAMPMPGCVECGKQVSTRRAYRCTGCSHAEQASFRKAIGIYGSDPDANLRRRWTKRNRLDNAAPGPYNRKRRCELLTLWQRQGRRCAYCVNGPAEQVDHVIPLSRGGTNFEGNLVPACAACNYDKWDNLLSAWRYGISAKRPPVTWVSLEPTERRQSAKERRWVQLPIFSSVCVCGSAISGRAEFCSARCASRTAYRRKVGIPDNAPIYSRSGRPRARQEAA